MDLTSEVSLTKLFTINNSTSAKFQVNVTTPFLVPTRVAMTKEKKKKITASIQKTIIQITRNTIMNQIKQKLKRKGQKIISSIKKTNFF